MKKHESGIQSYLDIQELLKKLKAKSQDNLSGEESMRTYNLRIGLQNAILGIESESHINDERFQIHCEGKIDFSNAKLKAIRTIEKYARVFDSSFVGDRITNICPMIEEYIFPKNILDIKNYRIYSMKDCAISHRDIVNFLSKEKVFFLDTIGLVLVHNFDYALKLPNYYELLSPVSNISAQTDLCFRVIKQWTGCAKFHYETLFTDNFFSGEYNFANMPHNRKSSRFILVFY